MSQNSIKVIDFSGDLVSRCTPKIAAKHVSRGHAHWVADSTIQLANENYGLGAGARARGCFYINGHGFATLQGAKGLPLAGDEVRLFMGKRPAEPPRDLPTVEISRRSVPYFDAPARVPLWQGERLA